MKKQTKKNDKFTVTEVGTLIDAMRRDFKPILEDIPSIKAKLDSVFEQVGKNTEDIQLIKHILSSHTEEIKSIKGTLKEHSGILSHILEELKSKVSRSEFELLEKKVSSLSE